MKSNNKVKVVFASGVNGEFGSQLELPWDKLPKEDAKHFRKTTLGDILVMGSNTWKSLTKALPDRYSVVFSSNPLIETKNGDHPNTIICRSGILLNNLLDVCRMFLRSGNDISIIGGKNFIQNGIVLADEVYWTKLSKDDQSEWDCDVRLDHVEIEKYLAENYIEEVLNEFSKDGISGKIIKYVRK